MNSETNKKHNKRELEELKLFFNQYTGCIYFNENTEECRKTVDIYENQLFQKHPSEWYSIIRKHLEK